MRPRARAALLALAAVAAFGAVVAIQLGRSRHGASEPAEGLALPAPAEPPPPAGLAPAGSAVERGTVPRAGPREEPARPTRPALRIRLQLGALASEDLPRATVVLRLLGADGVESTLATPAAPRATETVVQGAEGVRGSASSEGGSTDIIVQGLPPGAVRALAVVRSGAGRVLGMAGPLSIPVGASEALLDVVPSDRLGTVTVDVRRGGAPFGPAAFAVRAGGLTVDSVSGVRGRAAPVRVPTGAPLEVALVDAPGQEDLGLPPPQELTLAPREARDATFELDEGVAFTIHALGPDGRPLPFHARVWVDREGRGPRPAPGLLLTSGPLLEHVGRGPAGELSVLVIPTRTGAPTWAHASLSGRTAVPVDVRVGLEGGVLDLRLVDEDGAPRAGWQVELVRTDASDLDAFSAWSGSVDATGHLRTPPLPAGAYLLEVGGRLVRPVSLPEAGLVMSLAAPALSSPPASGPVLDVTMSDPAGQPRALASAFVRPEGEGWGVRLVPRRDEPGRFEAVVLSAGRFRVVAPWTWGAGARHGAIDVPVTLPGEGVLRIDVRVPPP